MPLSRHNISFRIPTEIPLIQFSQHLTSKALFFIRPRP